MRAGVGSVTGTSLRTRIWIWSFSIIRTQTLRARRTDLSRLSPSCTFLHLWNWPASVSYPERRRRPSTCLSNGCDAWAGSAETPWHAAPHWWGRQRGGPPSDVFRVCSRAAACGVDVHGETSRGTGHVRGREGDRGRTEWGRELMLFLLQSLSCPKPAEVFANRTWKRADEAVWNGRRLLLRAAIHRGTVARPLKSAIVPNN